MEEAGRPNPANTVHARRREGPIDAPGRPLRRLAPQLETARLACLRSGQGVMRARDRAIAPAIEDFRPVADADVAAPRGNRVDGAGPVVEAAIAARLARPPTNPRSIRTVTDLFSQAVIVLYTGQTGTEHRERRSLRARSRGRGRLRSRGSGALGASAGRGLLREDPRAAARLRWQNASPRPTDPPQRSRLCARTRLLDNLVLPTRPLAPVTVGNAPEGARSRSLARQRGCPPFGDGPGEQRRQPRRGSLRVRAQWDAVRCGAVGRSPGARVLREHPGPRPAESHGLGERRLVPEAVQFPDSDPLGASVAMVTATNSMEETLLQIGEGRRGLRRCCFAFHMLPL